ncbi:hypothetical protein GCM10028790_17700 [Micromonospora taraxaci]|uniref:Uncharacterized protein n=1 Tax=Micromonospora taraxaci TaxID=1316803 RepID=A0A561VY62_9ACTN|nr:hypothetical protein FHU34_111871 [Micromonospora taraxaci]
MYTYVVPADFAPTAERCQAPQMTLLSLIETTSGQYSLLLEAGTTPVDDLIR